MWGGGALDTSATPVNLYGFVLRTRETLQFYIVLAVDERIQSARIQKKNVHSFQAVTLSLPLSAILMASMNNILQVSSRSSSALPRRKLSNSRQVIPLCDSSVPKVAVNDSPPV